MRISKGKPVFGRKDTIDFSTLGEIIHAWLVKFRDDYVNLELPSVPADIAEACSNHEEARQKYIGVMDKMIYAFADEEPEYAGTFYCAGEPIENSRLFSLDIQVSDHGAWDRYMEDCDEHERKVAEGLKLFGEYFRSLWV